MGKVPPPPLRKFLEVGRQTRRREPPGQAAPSQAALQVPVLLARSGAGVLGNREEAGKETGGYNLQASQRESH